MANIRQWQFGYKDGQKPVQTAICEATSLEIAEKVARTWCSKQVKAENPGAAIKFCFVRPVVVADESILESYQNPDRPQSAPSPLPTATRQ